MPNPLKIKVKQPFSTVPTIAKPVKTPSITVISATKTAIITIASNIFYTPIGHKP